MRKSNDSADQPLCLRFCNTVDERAGYANGKYEIRGEELISFERCLAWLRANTGMSSALLERVKKQEPEHSGRVATWFQDVREAMFAVLRSVSTREKLTATMLKPLNEVLARLPSKELRLDGQAIVHTYADEALNAKNVQSMLLADVMESFIEIAQAEPSVLERLKVCEGEDCGWIFFDTSKNGSRRWCSMEDCGNRAKARTFFNRKRRKG